MGERAGLLRATSIGVEAFVTPMELRLDSRTTAAPVRPVAAFA
jgi:hypothetical protein